MDLMVWFKSLMMGGDGFDAWILEVIDDSFDFYFWFTRADEFYYSI